MEAKLSNDELKLLCIRRINRIQWIMALLIVTLAIAIYLITVYSTTSTLLQTRLAEIILYDLHGHWRVESSIVTDAQDLNKYFFYIDNGVFEVRVLNTSGEVSTVFSTYWDNGTIDESATIFDESFVFTLYLNAAIDFKGIRDDLKSTAIQCRMYLTPERKMQLGTPLMVRTSSVTAIKSRP